MWAVSALCKAGRDEHPSPRGGPEVACDATPRCRLGGLGMDIHVACPLTCPLDVTMEQLHPPVHRGVAAALPHPAMSAPHPKWLQRSSHSNEGMAQALLN